MTSALTELLSRLLEGGTLRAGQLEIGRAGEAFELRHVDDAGRADLEHFSRYEDARQLALYDDTGAFRPLKTAPNLRRGWLLHLETLSEVHLALDYFYP